MAEHWKCGGAVVSEHHVPFKGVKFGFRNHANAKIDSCFSSYNPNATRPSQTLTVSRQSSTDMS